MIQLHPAQFMTLLIYITGEKLLSNDTYIQKYFFTGIA